jgi:ribosomal protein L11 methyltransferase
MSSSNSLSPRRAGKTWCWRRWIDPAAREEWIARMPPGSWALLEKPRRALLTVYFQERSGALRLVRQWGGRVRAMSAKEWLPRGPLAVLRVGNGLEIFHEKPRGRPGAGMARLHLPHGLAFGSGEHATTFMLLRALSLGARLEKKRVLDLGTGSGVLALAARRWGATKIVAIDFDAEAIRTARRNEALNFRELLIRWRKADVKRLRARGRYDLVLANLFSGILGEAAGPIAAAVAPGGELWLSGILRRQEEEVAAAYQKLGLRLARLVHRGKWAMLQWRKSDAG